MAKKTIVNNPKSTKTSATSPAKTGKSPSGVAVQDAVDDSLTRLTKIPADKPEEDEALDDKLIQLAAAEQAVIDPSAVVTDTGMIVADNGAVSEQPMLLAQADTSGKGGASAAGGGALFADNPGNLIGMITLGSFAAIAGGTAIYHETHDDDDDNPAPPPTNSAPVITSNGGGATAAVSAAENQTTVTTVTATDVDAGDGKTFSISGGADAAKFAIDATTGVLTFVAAPDFEAPADAGANNVYDVQVTVTDTAGLKDVQDIAVTVTDRFELYHNPGVLDALGNTPGEPRIAFPVDVPVSNITVISSIIDNVSLDVTPNTSAVVTLLDSTISVQANADDSSAALRIQNATGTVTALDVASSGVPAAAYVDIYTDGPLTINQIDITSSGNAINWSNDSYASVNISGDVTMGDFITITASGTSAEASLYTNPSDAVVFTDVPGGITVTASGYDSYANMEVYNASGTISSLTVEATAGSAEADVYMTASSGDVLSLGDVTVTASGTYASADVELYDVTFVDSVINVTSSSNSAEAYLYADAASGTISSLNVTTAGLTQEIVTSLDPIFNMAAQSLGPNYITDGGDDQYDNGNYLNSDTVTNISYSYSTVDTDNFGAGSQNVMVYQDAVFGTLVTNNSSTTFAVTGNLGADGYGYEDILAIPGAYNGYQAIIQRTWGDDKSINRIFIYQANPDVGFNSLDGDTDSDDFIITGLSEVSTFAYFVAFGDTNKAPFSEATLTDFFHAAVDNVLLDSAMSEQPIADMQTAFSDNFSLLSDTVNGTTGYEVTGTSAEASVYIDVDGSLEISSLTVEANTNYSSAEVYMAASSGDVLTIGDITVTASGVYASADVDLYGVTFNDSVISITSSNYDAYASLDVAAASGSISGVTVLSSANYTEAAFYLHDSSDVNIGDVTVTASGASSEASVWLGYDYDRITVAFDSSNIAVTASGYDSFASFDVNAASGTISSLTVEASGDGADASADIVSDGTLTINQIDIEASGNPGYYPWYDSNANVNISGDVTLGDFITITASGVSADASLSANWSDAVIFADNASGGITVTASSYISDAEMQVYNASGVISSLTVEATGEWSSAYAYMSASSADGDVLSLGDVTVTASEQYASADVGLYGVTFADSVINVTSSSYSAYASLDVGAAAGTISSITVATGESADYTNAAFYLGDSSDVAVGDITITAGGYGSEAGFGHDWWDTATVAFNSSVIEVTASGDQSSAGIYNLNDASGTISSLTVAANGEGSNAEVYISGDVTMGDVTLTASDYFASADVGLNGVAFDNSVINVTSSGYGADASFDVSAATGIISSITVVTGASADDANALLYLHGSNDVTVGDITVTAGGHSSDAGVGLGYYPWDATTAELNNSAIAVTASGDGSNAGLFITDASGTISSLTVEASGNVASMWWGGWNGSNASVDINGDVTMGDIVTITASGSSSDATFTMSTSDAVVFTDSEAGGITVTASGFDSYANMDVYNASGTISSLTVEASGDSADASANIESDGTLTINQIDIEVSANSYSWWNSATASANINGDVTLGDFITVTASGNSADAWFNRTGCSDVTIFTDNLAGGITVTASSYDADASMTIYNATGTISSLTAEATAYSSSADIYMAVSFGNVLTVGDVTLTASDSYASAVVDLYGVTFDDSVINVTSSSYDTLASLDVYAATGTISSITVSTGESSAYENAGVYLGGASDVTIGDITITAGGYSSDVWLGHYSWDTATVAFSDSVIEVTASGDGSNAGLYNINDASGTISSLTVETSGNAIPMWWGLKGSNATVNISGDVTMGDITVTASGNYASADIYLNGVTFADSTINITSSSYDANTSLFADNASGTLINLYMNATGNSSDVGAELTLTDGSFIQNTNVVISPTSVVALEVDQTVHGGDVYAASNSVSGDVIFNLTYTNATGDNVSLGHISSDTSFVIGGFDGAFHLALSGTDQDYHVSTDVATLLDNMLTINGFDSGFSLDTLDTSRDDTIEFLGIFSGDYDENLTDAGTIEVFLANAETALEGGLEAYFGVVGENGYLAVDPDNDGITQLIEFTNLTDFDPSRFTSTAPPPL